MVINGIMATIETKPKASVITLLFNLPEASVMPIIRGNKKLAVIGPEVTPPESNAIPVNISGVKKVSPNAIEYPWN